MFLGVVGPQLNGGEETLDFLLVTKNIATTTIAAKYPFRNTFLSSSDTNGKKANGAK